MRGDRCPTLARVAPIGARRAARDRHAPRLLQAGPPRAAISRRHAVGAGAGCSSPRFIYRVEREPAGVRPALRTASATSSSRRVCRSSCGAASPTTSCSTWPRRTGWRSGDARAQVAAHARRSEGRRRSSRTSRASGCICASWTNLQTEAPGFDDNLRQSFRRETELLFDTIVREDRSIVELLDADYTFVDERLARHYGMPNIRGSHFRRVALGPSSPRRGLLGHGSMLTVTSVGDADVAGHARQVDSREPARRAAAAAAAWRRDESGERGAGSPRRRRCAAARAAPREPGVRVVSQHHGPARIRAGELRSDRRLARDGRAGDDRRTGQLADGTPLAARPGLRKAVLTGDRRVRDDGRRKAADLRPGPAGRTITICRRARRSFGAAANELPVFVGARAWYRRSDAVSECVTSEARGFRGASRCSSPRSICRVERSSAARASRSRCRSSIDDSGGTALGADGGPPDALRLHLHPARRDDGQVDAGDDGRASSSPRSCSRSRRSTTAISVDQRSRARAGRAVDRRGHRRRREPRARGGRIPERRASREDGTRLRRRRPSIRSPRSTSVRTRRCRRSSCRSRVGLNCATRVSPAPIATRCRGSPRRCRCRWRTTRRSSSSACSATAAPTRARGARNQARSLLDSIRDQVADAREGPAGRRTGARSREYLDEVREIERRVRSVDARLSPAISICPRRRSASRHVRGAPEADVRPAGARLAGGDHAHLDADARAREQQRRLSRAAACARASTTRRTIRTSARTWTSSR